MLNTTRFTTLFVVLFALASGLAQAFRFDGGNTPQTIVPTSSTLSPGTWTGVTVTMNQTGTTPTTVYLTSSHPSILQVPSTLVIPADTLARPFIAYALEAPDDGMGAPDGFFQKLAVMSSFGTLVTITATANGQAVWTTVTVQ